MMSRTTGKLRLSLWLVTAAVFCLLAEGCKTSSSAARGGNAGNEVAMQMLAAPAARDVSGKMSVTYGKTGPVNVKARMRWNQSIQLSLNALGLLEVASANIMPDRILLINRVSGVYCELAYSDIPHSDLLKFDFQTVQGLFWGRVFVYGQQETSRAASSLKIGKRSDSGALSVTDTKGGFQFDTDGTARVLKASKSSVAYKMSVSYRDFIAVDAGCTLPAVMEANLSVGKKSHSARIRYSGFESSGTKATSDVTTGLKKVSFDEFFGFLKKLL